MFQNVLQPVVALCLNAISAEAILREAPQLADAIVGAQFAWISMAELPRRLQMHSGYIRWKRSQAPLPFYAGFTALFAIVSRINASLFDLGISITLQLIFRSAAPLFSMIVGRIFFGKSYSNAQMVSILLLAFGVAIVSFADFKVQSPQYSMDYSIESVSIRVPNAKFLLAFSLMSFSIMLSAVLGHIQNIGFKRYGQSPEESLFYTHLFSLLWFSLLKPSILANPSMFFGLPDSSATHVFRVRGLFIIPMSIRTLFICNIISQYFCVHGIYKLSKLTSPLFVSIVLSFRKVLSIFFSVILFGSILSSLHYVGSILVFFSSIVYTYNSSKNSGKKHF